MDSLFHALLISIFSFPSTCALSLVSRTPDLPEQEKLLSQHHQHQNKKNLSCCWRRIPDYEATDGRRGARGRTGSCFDRRYTLPSASKNWIIDRNPFPLSSSHTHMYRRSIKRKGHKSVERYGGVSLYSGSMHALPQHEMMTTTMVSQMVSTAVIE